MKIEMRQVTAVVLAGGFGTRVRHLLPDLPKPMAPVAGKPFLEWVVRCLAAQGIQRVILSTGYKSDVVENHFQQHAIGNVSVVCAEETEPLGTAGGFLNATAAASSAPAAWLVVNGDSLLFVDLAAVLSELADPGCSGVIVGRRVSDAARYGSLAVDAGGRLLRFDEKKAGAGVINGGIYLLRDSLLGQFSATRPLSFEKDVFPTLVMQGGNIRVLASEGAFLDIGTPETLPLAEEFIVQNRHHFLAEPD